MLVEGKGQAPEPRRLHAEQQRQLALFLQGDHLPTVDLVAELQGGACRAAIMDTITGEIIQAGADLPQQVGEEIPLIAAYLLHHMP